MAKAPAAETKPVKAPKASKAAAVAADKPSVFARLGQYFKDVRTEMKRVVWPSRPEVLNSSVVVVVTLIFFVLFTLVFDSVAYQALRLATGATAG